MTNHKSSPIPEHYPETDAFTLAEAAVIRSTPGRLHNAKIAAAKQAEEQAIKARALKAIAKIKPPKTPKTPKTKKSK